MEAYQRKGKRSIGNREAVGMRTKRGMDMGDRLDEFLDQKWW